MAREGLTLEMAAERTGVDVRTLKSVLGGTHRPHSRTLHRLATGLGVEADEFFHDPGHTAQWRFDRATNPAVDEVIQAHPRVFDGWEAADFDELFSRFGHGGALTPEGALAAAETMNGHREVHRQVALVLESNDRALLAEFVEMLYRRNVIRPGEKAGGRRLEAGGRNGDASS